MVYKFKADFEFEADDIDDAFIRISKHFLDMYLSNDSHLIMLGTAKISPIDNTEGGQNESAS